MLIFCLFVRFYSRYLQMPLVIDEDAHHIARRSAESLLSLGYNQGTLLIVSCTVNRIVESFPPEFRLSKGSFWLIAEMTICHLGIYHFIHI